MSRISSYAVNTQLINRLLLTQDRLLDLQAQVSSQKKSQTYSGIARDSQRLVNIETVRDRLQKYITNNEQQQTRLDIASTAVEAARVSINDFKKSLVSYKLGKPTTAEEVDKIQSAAFRALRDIEDVLNTEVDGRYLFGGNRSRTEPVDLGISSVSQFQSTYDGAIVKVAETRDAHLDSMSLSNDEKKENKLYIDDSNFLRFTQDSDGDTSTAGTSTIRATSNLFGNLASGATIVISDTTSNNGTYTVKSVSSDGTTVTVVNEMLTNETVYDLFTAETTTTSATFTVESGATFTFTTSATFLASSLTLSGTAGTFSSLSADEFFTVAGTTNNNYTFQVQSVAADGSSITINNNPANITLADGSVVDNNGAGKLTFSRSGDTIVADNAVFSGVSTGDTITVAGTDENNGTYTVASVSADGKTVTIESSKITNEGLSSGSNFYSYQNGTRVSFSTAAQTIQILTSATASSTAVANVFKGLAVGDRIAITNSDNGANTNDGTVEITAISSDYSTITVSSGVSSTLIDSTQSVYFLGSGNGFTYTSDTRLRFTSNTIEVLDTASAAVFNAFSNLATGSTIAVSGVGTAYNSSFTVASVTTAALTISGAFLGTGGTVTDPDGAAIEVYAASGTVKATSFYSGDDQAQTVRVDDDRSFDFNVQANDPAFEKAIRAMKIILQGEFGKEGGLDNNLDRVDDALYLLSASLDSTVDGTPPFGTEETGSIEQVQQDIGFNQYLISTINKTHTDYIGFLEQSIAKIEDADPLESITRLLDDERALSASYQTFARIRQLSLTNFL